MVAKSAYADLSSVCTLATMPLETSGCGRSGAGTIRLEIWRCLEHALQARSAARPAVHRRADADRFAEQRPVRQKTFPCAAWALGAGRSAEEDQERRRLGVLGQGGGVPGIPLPRCAPRPKPTRRTGRFLTDRALFGTRSASARRWIAGRAAHPRLKRVFRLPPEHRPPGRLPPASAPGRRGRRRKTVGGRHG